MKTCYNCKISKPLRDFAKRKTKSKDGFLGTCKLCVNNRRNERRKTLSLEEKLKISEKTKKHKEIAQKYVNDIKSSGCSICGYNKSNWALIFHHRNKSEKKYNVSQMVHTCKSLEKIQQEIDKCDLICQNCHHELHEKEALERGWYNRPVNESTLS